jgi:hypothetical protein
MSNYKTEATASEVADELIRRTKLTAPWGYVSGVPTVSLGDVGVKYGGGVVIQILDRRGEVDQGWDALPSFINNVQPVYNTGVAKIITESTVDVSQAAAFASNVLTVGNGANTPFPAGGTITIDGVVLTEGVDFLRGATDDNSVLAIANAINANPLLAPVISATYVQGGAGNSTVTVTADFQGAQFNNITTVTNAGAVAVWTSGTLTGGAGSSFSGVTPFATFLKVIGVVAKRGLKLELWQTPTGTPPMTGTALNTSYFQGDFFPNDFWPISGQT